MLNNLNSFQFTLLILMGILVINSSIELDKLFLILEFAVESLDINHIVIDNL